MASTAPTMQEIKELFDYADDYWRAWRENANLDYMYFRDGVPRSEWHLQMNAASRYVEIRPPRARQKIINATTQMLANPLQIVIEKLVAMNTDEPTQKVEEEADYGEALLSAILYHTTRRNNNVDPIRASAVSMFITGMGALECGYDESDNPRPTARKGTKQYGSWLDKRQHHFPIYIQANDPLTLWPSPDDGQSWVIKRFERTGFELLNRYPTWKPESAESDPNWKSKKYTFLAYYDRQWCVYGEWDYGQALKTTEHFMGTVPIVIWSSGQGDDNGPPDMRYRGLYTDVRKGKLFVAYARARSQVDAINANYAWPTRFIPKSWGNVSFNPGDINPIDLDPDHIADLQKGIFSAQGMTVPQGIYTEAQSILDEIDAGTISEVIGSGELPASDPTSKSIRRINEAAARLSWSRIYTEQAWERVFGLVLRALGSPDYFGADEQFVLTAPAGKTAKIVNISRDKVPKNPIIRCHISPEAPQEKFAKLQAGLAMYTQGPLDAWTLLEEYAGFADGGQQVMERKMKQRILDALAEQAIQTALMRATGQAQPETGIRDTINAMQQGDQTAEQQAGPGAPVPGGVQDQASVMKEMTGGFNNAAMPTGNRGRQGMRGM